MESALESDIRNEPEILENFLKHCKEEIRDAAKVIKRNSPSFIYMVARGSSENAARYAQYAFGEMATMPVALGNPSLFTLYSKTPDLSGSAVCAISQSGQSPDIVSVVRHAVERGVLAIGITNDPSSPLAEHATHTVYLRANEKSIAATQTYVNSLAAIGMLAGEIAGSVEKLKELNTIPALLKDTLEKSSVAKEIANCLKDSKNLFVLGRGYNYSSAYEISLKLKELTYILAHPYSTAEFLHGPIAVVEKGFPVMVISCKGAVSSAIPTICETLSSLGARKLLITNQRERVMKNILAFEIPDCQEWLSPFPVAIAGQVIALQTALLKGIDPDRPRTIKKVTKTK